MSKKLYEDIKEKVQSLYGADQKYEIYNKIKELIENHQTAKSNGNWVSEKDTMLITYGDTISSEGEQPLETLANFLEQFIKEDISSVHILPFYPYTSDDGFSVVDYREVNPDLGNWNHIKKLSQNYKMMFDAVINHISKSSPWFKGYINGEPSYKNYFIEADINDDYSDVVRPRALPLFKPVKTNNGEKYIWTTFSEDQIDLNYENPNVLLEILDILLMYSRKGAKYIRLDAIGFLWKKQGTSCIHLEEAHTIVQIIRNVFDIADDGTIIITETNVPHKENISYFGDGTNEAHMVYQFPLPPLTLFSFYQQNARKLLDWLKSIETTPGKTTFFNFLSSHDGIGMRPTEGILSEEERDLMLKNTEQHGGYVSYKDNGDGTKSPYELNINYFDALCSPDESLDIGKKKMIAAQNILLSLAGVPGIYIHSLLGSRNDQQSVKNSGIYRRINREKLEKNTLFSELKDTNHLRHDIFHSMMNNIKIRTNEKSFHPLGRQEVLFIDNRIFSICRTSLNESEQITILVNVSNDNICTSIDEKHQGIDLISGNVITSKITLNPYQTMWIKTKKL